jgi:hypothetical protein
MSIHRSFLIGLYHPADLRSGKICGFLQHDISGLLKQFSCMSDLIRSIRALLRNS